MSAFLALTPFLLNDEHEIPAVGLGTFGMTDEGGVATILAGLHQGYRLLDTAVGYGNEAEVGEAIRRSELSPTEVVVTMKIPGRGLGYDAARCSIEQSRRTLGVDRIGLHLIHWPMPPPRQVRRHVASAGRRAGRRRGPFDRGLHFTSRYLVPIRSASTGISVSAPSPGARWGAARSC